MKQMMIRCEKLEMASPIVFELFDKDLISDDYMGRAVIHVNLFHYIQLKDLINSKDLIVDGDKMLNPKWYDIWNPSGEKKGQILLSFNALVNKGGVVNVEFPT